MTNVVRCSLSFFPLQSALFILCWLLSAKSKSIQKQQYMVLQNIAHVEVPLLLRASFQHYLIVWYTTGANKTIGNTRTKRDGMYWYAVWLWSKWTNIHTDEILNKNINAVIASWKATFFILQLKPLYISENDMKWAMMKMDTDVLSFPWENIACTV